MNVEIQFVAFRLSCGCCGAHARVAGDKTVEGLHAFRESHLRPRVDAAELLVDGQVRVAPATYVR